MKGKKVIAMGLAVMMAAFSFTACSKGETEVKESEKKAMGRFVEKSFDMPADVENGTQVAYLFKKNKQNQIEVYSRKREESKTPIVIKNTLEGSDWKTEKSEWQSMKNFIYSFDYDENGVMYGLGMNEEGKLTVYISKDGKTAEETDIQGLKEISSSDMPSKIYCMKDGILLLSFRDHIIAYQAGNEIMTMDSGSEKCAVYEKEVLVSNRQGDGFLVYDLEKKEKKAEHPFDGNTTESTLTSDKDGNWYSCDKRGIHRMVKEGNIWETVVDGSLNSMRSPQYHAEILIAGNQNDFYVVFQYGDGQRALKHYVYDEKVETMPSKTLSIVSLEENQSILQAVVNFQNENPEVRVNYQALLSDGSVTANDAVKKINTELLAKKGADLIVLDGMPVQSYIEKEVLMDLSEVITSVVEKEGIYKNIVDAVKSGDALYGFPVKIGLPVIYGTKEAVEAGNTLQDLASYAEKNAETEIFGEGMYTYQSLMNQLANLYSDEYMNEDGKIDEDKLISFLENVKKISEQTKAAEKGSTSPEELFHLNFAPADMLVQKLASCYITEYRTSFDYYAPFAGIEKIKGTFAPVKHSFIPHGSIGINNASENREMAVKFFESLFTEPLQKVDLGDGFPVTKKGTDIWNKEKNDFYIGSPSFEATQPDESKIKEVTDLCGTMNQAIVTDAVLVEMIANEAAPYLSGQKTAKETAAAIASQAQAYLAE